MEQSFLWRVPMGIYPFGDVAIRAYRIGASDISQTTVLGNNDFGRARAHCFLMIFIPLSTAIRRWFYGTTRCKRDYLVDL